ncbi:MAG: hypothetical protein RL587_1031 [Actinomycetota bacterium]|jgi:phosphatidylinositol alpha-1,6-mannosyltransferase
MARTLVITNDFPPRKGGIQTFVQQLVGEMYSKSFVVFTSNWPGSSEFDKAQNYEVVRTNTKVLLPWPWQIRRAKELAHLYDCDTVLFGALAPLGLMSHALRRGGKIKRVVALTHGHEAGWATLPVMRRLLTASGKYVDRVTFLTGFTESKIRKRLRADLSFAKLTPGVDSKLFAPVSTDLKSQLRKKHGIGPGLVILGVSRLMKRKGFDSLIELLAEIEDDYPTLELVIAGGGPDKKRLLKLAKRLDVLAKVKFIRPLNFEQLPEIYATADIFAMPCRTRNFGLDVEGFGIVYLEAAATGLPVIAGNSGGAPEAIVDGETGYVVSREALKSRVLELLDDPMLRKSMGDAGRQRVITDFRINQRGEQLRALLG